MFETKLISLSIFYKKVDYHIFIEIDFEQQVVKKEQKIDRKYRKSFTTLLIILFVWKIEKNVGNKSYSSFHLLLKNPTSFFHKIQY